MSAYKHRIYDNYRHKFGLQCWFVAWGWLQSTTEPRLAVAPNTETTPDLATAFSSGTTLPEAECVKPVPLVLRLALECIPASHLKVIFERMCRDVAANGAGFPDLIQFFPERKQYRLIEVKGPGDRLRDNQRRWLHHFAQHGIPASVCHVQWDDASDATKPNRSRY